MGHAAGVHLQANRRSIGVPDPAAGTHLARAEAATIYRLLAEEFPRLRLMADVEWLDSIIRRTPLQVPVAWEN